MNLLILASVPILGAIIAFTLHRSKKSDAEIQKEFWERERLANSTRRKPLDDLNYIEIPLDELPMDLLLEDPKAEDYVRIIRELSQLKIVNFTGISNTDLKLRYGAPNIDLLTSYDQNYTLLARTLQQWAQCLYDEGHREEACQVLEFAISTGTDVSGTYRLLCKIYKENNTPENIGSLFPIAETLNSAMKDTIVRILQEASQSDG